jgi:hypothetical protein
VCVSLDGDEQWVVLMLECCHGGLRRLEVLDSGGGGGNFPRECGQPS